MNLLVFDYQNIFLLFIYIVGIFVQRFFAQ